MTISIDEVSVHVHITDENHDYLRQESVVEKNADDAFIKAITESVLREIDIRKQLLE